MTAHECPAGRRPPSVRLVRVHCSAACMFGWTTCASRATQDSSSSASNLKMQALLFLHTALDTAEAVAFQPSLPALAPPVLVAAGERYYKVGCYAHRQAATVLMRSP